MPNFSTNKIEVLFCLCLVKAKVKRARSQYDGLSEAINNANPKNDPNITQKYLDEGIDKRLQAAFTDSLPTVGINPTYLDVLALYLGYENFLAFEIVFDAAYTQLSQLGNNRIRFFHPLGKKSVAAQMLATLSYPEQLNALNIDYSTLPKAPHFFKEDEESPFTVLWVDQDWVNRNSLDFDTNVDETPLLLASQNEDGQTILQPITKAEFALYFQLLILGIDQDTSSVNDEKDVSNANNRPIIIKDSGAINLGHIGSFKAKYFSGNDMTINIKKKK
ncbi:MAG: hypothetical protein Roseis2KO_43820 [Roseivirga sp.]